MERYADIAPRHVVGKTVFDVSYSREEDAYAQEAIMHSFIKDRLIAVIEETFNEHAMPGMVLRLERLEVDLGSVSVDGYQQQMEQRLRTCLGAQLREQRTQVHLRTESGGLASTKRSEWEQLAYYLGHGHLPWNGAALGPRSCDQLLRSAIQHNPAELVRMIKHSGQRTLLIKRLARQFHGELLKELASLLAPSQAAGLIRVMEAIEIIRQAAWPLSSGSEAADLAWNWETLLHALMRGGNMSRTATKFVDEVVKRIAMLNQQPYAKVLAALAHTARLSSCAGHSSAELTELMQALQRDQKISGIGAMGAGQTSGEATGQALGQTAALISEQAPNQSATPATNPEDVLEGKLRSRLFAALSNGNFAKISSDWPVLIGSKRDFLRNALLVYLTSEEVRQAVSISFPEPILRDIVGVMSLGASTFINGFMAEMAQIARQILSTQPERLGHIDQEVLMRRIWLNTLGYVREHSRDGMHPGGYIATQLRMTLEQGLLSLDDWFMMLPDLLQTVHYDALDEGRRDQLLIAHKSLNQHAGSREELGITELRWAMRVCIALAPDVHPELAEGIMRRVENVAIQETTETHHYLADLQRILHDDFGNGDPYYGAVQDQDPGLDRAELASARGKASQGPIDLAQMRRHLISALRRGDVAAIRPLWPKLLRENSALIVEALIRAGRTLVVRKRIAEIFPLSMLDDMLRILAPRNIDCIAVVAKYPELFQSAMGGEHLDVEASQRRLWECTLSLLSADRADQMDMTVFMRSLIHRWSSEQSIPVGEIIYHLRSKLAQRVVPDNLTEILSTSLIKLAREASLVAAAHESAEQAGRTLLQAYELYQRLVAWIAQPDSRRGSSEDTCLPIIEAMSRDHPSQLLKFYRLLQTGYYSPRHVAGALTYQELRALIHAFVSLVSQADNAAQADFLLAMDHTARQARDAHHYYAQVMTCLLHDQVVDFEGAAASDVSLVAPSSAEQARARVDRAYSVATLATEGDASLSSLMDIEAGFALLLAYLNDGYALTGKERAGMQDMLALQCINEPEVLRSRLAGVMQRRAAVKRLINLLPER